MTARGLLALVLATGCGPRAEERATEPSEASASGSLEQARQLAGDVLVRHPADRLRWGWETGILTFGLARLARVDPQGGWSTPLVEYYQAHPRPRLRRPDDYAPALGAAVLLDAQGSSVRPALEHVAEGLREAPRNPLGALDHLDPDSALGRVYPPSIWVDSLVMYGLSAALIGQALEDPALLAFAHAQPVVFATHLQDPSTGLFRHAYLYERGTTRPRSETYWLRGNGWVALALVELLATMEPEQPQFLPTRVILRRLAAGLTEHRSRGGLWHTVIDAPRTYEETSGSALVAAALAKGARLGLLPGEYREQARQTLEALNRRLRNRRRGVRLTGTSGRTIPSGAAGYGMIRRGSDLPYGVGAYLLLAAELAVDAP